MNKNKAFSLSEVIMSIFLLMLVLIPAIKLNTNQFKAYKTLQTYDQSLAFVRSLKNYVSKNQNYINNNIHIEYLDRISFFRDFQNFKYILPNKNFQNFKLIIDIKIVEVDFKIKKSEAAIGNIYFLIDNKSFSENFIKFRE